LFRDFREEQGVFPKARYVFQSDVHPRIGGGIVGSTSELAEFAQKFFSGEIVSRKIVSKMMLDKTPKFTVKMKYNPVSQQIREQWHYGTGLWIECAERRWKKSCEQELIYSSMGHGGTYIWYDAKAEIWAVLVRDDTGLAIFPAPPSVRFLRKIRPFMEGLR
jgi:CubicO group peptidase (beta-lactamase class C family)